jgi:[calcium/calmodulin-dependent protein kinase] kinase
LTEILISTPATSQNNNPTLLKRPEDSVIQEIAHMDSNIQPSKNLGDSNSTTSHASIIHTSDPDTPTLAQDPASAAVLHSQSHFTKHLWHPTLSIPPHSDIGFGIENPQVTSSHTTIQGPTPDSPLQNSQNASKRHRRPNVYETHAKQSDNLSSRGSEDRLADPASAASDPGIFTPKSSPLRPHFRADTSEAFPTHDLNDWYKHAPKETHSAEVDVDPVSGRKIINDYEIIGELGRGVHGKVKLGRNLHTNKHVAIKIIERVSKRRRLGRTGNQEAKIKREIAILKKARHENIVGLLEVIDDPAMKKVYIVLEHVELGEIKWRTSGEDEICLVEYRNCLRELDGVAENDTAMYEDQHNLETTRRNIERQEQRTREGNVRNIGPWSLEHGGQSDQEDFSTPPVAQNEIADSSTSEQHHQESTHTQFNEPTVGANDASYPMDGVKQPKNHDKNRLSDSFKTEEYHTAIEGHSVLDRTAYRPYDLYSRDEHGAQNFDSFMSSLGEYDLDRIPEHYRYVPVMTLSEARRAIRDTVLGLEYLHYQGVIHRDIKPANLLETKSHRIKISDFGVSYLGKAVKDQTGDEQSESDAQDYDEAIELAKTVGTPAFYAPELCSTDCDDDNPLPVTNQIDVWALGVTLYCFVFGRVPFHDQNTFVLMRHIAEQEVYIPRRRLKAVEDQDEGLEMASPSGSTSASPASPFNSNKRLPQNLEYEEVSDELSDLLKKLLTKDPRERIKLSEVKHHPWLLGDIKNPSRWIDESDPSRITQGKKIEVSKEDVESAVRLNVVDNLRKLTKRVIGGVIGLGKSHSRIRAKSTAAVPDTQASSNASSSSSISQEAKRHEFRRGSLRPDELIFSAIKASRDTDHPLSYSVTASPEAKEGSQYFKPSYSDEDFARIWPGRPVNLERGVSGTGSIRTIRPSDFHLRTGSGGLASTLQNTPQAIDTPTPLGGIFGGGMSKPIQSPVLSEIKAGRRRSTSLGRKSLAPDDPHAEPSLAISNATASGLVNLPAALQELNAASSSGAPSPGSSRPPSVAPHADVVRSRDADEPISRVSSVSSVASRGRIEAVGPHPHHFKNTFLPLLKEVSNDQPVTRLGLKDGTVEEEVTRAKEEQFRRLIQEDAKHRSDSIAEQHQKASTTQDACPPSPDDFIFERKASEASYHPPLVLPDHSHDYHHTTQQLPATMSEDRLTSEMSQSTSNRSLPSAFSATSSVGMDLGCSPDSTAKYSSAGDFATIEHVPVKELGQGHDSIMAIDDGDDSDDSFIEMSRPKRPESMRSARSTSMPMKNVWGQTGHDKP